MDRIINVGYKKFLIISLVFLSSLLKANENKCYMPYSVNNDHVVVGCEIPGYKMRYDIAQKMSLFMVVMPNDIKDSEHPSVFFSANTLDLVGSSLKDLFEADLKGVLKNRTKTIIVAKPPKQIPQKMGECYGVTLDYKDGTYPYETYFICKNASKKYAIIIQLQAKNKVLHDKHFSSFIKWANVPQLVKDYSIVEK